MITIQDIFTIPILAKYLIVCTNCDSSIVHRGTQHLTVVTGYGSSGHESAQTTLYPFELP